MTAGPIGVETAGEGWYIDGVYLSDIGVLEERDGWDDTPGVRGENATLLGYDGASWREKLYDVGQKTIGIGIHGALWDGLQWLVPATGSAQRALYEKNLDRLLRLLGTRHRPVMVERVYPDGSRRRALCEATGVIAPQPVADSYGKVQFDLTVLSAFWEDTEALTSRLAYSLSGPSSQTLEVYALRGQTAPCADAEATITGPCTSVSIKDQATGRGSSYGALTSGQTLVIQPDGRFAAERNGTSVITAVSFSGPTLLKISPAPSENEGPSVVVTATGDGPGFSVTIRSRAKFLR